MNNFNNNHKRLDIQEGYIQQPLSQRELQHRNTSVFSESKPAGVLRWPPTPIQSREKEAEG
jgi:hypothetical protein